jgi:hypothetical protein
VVVVGKSSTTAEVLNDGRRWIGPTTNAFSDEWAVVLSGMDSYDGLTA